MLVRGEVVVEQVCVSLSLCLSLCLFLTQVVMEQDGIELGFLSQQGSFFGEGPIIDPRSHHYR